MEGLFLQFCAAEPDRNPFDNITPLWKCIEIVRPITLFQPNEWENSRMKEPFLARLPKGDDLLEAITREFREQVDSQGRIQCDRAVTLAVLGYYDPQTRRYVNREFEGALEIVACMGNVSEKEGQIFVHAHVTLSGEDYRCIGGHLMPGTEIFAAELYATPLPGKTPVREFDEPTGLALWSEF